MDHIFWIKGKESKSFPRMTRRMWPTGSTWDFDANVVGNMGMWKNLHDANNFIFLWKGKILFPKHGKIMGF